MAYFKETEHVTITYTVNDEAMGTVSRSSDTINPETGTVTEVTATAKSGYEFVEWKDASGKQVSTNATFTPTKPDGGWTAETYTAVFEEKLT